MDDGDKVTLVDVQNARERISPYIHRTPVLRSQTLNDLAGRDLYLKTESFQKTGVFKVRGALNAVTHSSGNHGQAVSYACDVVGLICIVVVPTGTSAVKIRAIENYGAKVVFCEQNPLSRQEVCAKIALETGHVIIHPYDNYDVIAGQGTTALELLDEVPDLDAILVPISGGGLTSGIAVATKGLRPACRIYPVEPYGKELQPCLVAGQRLWPDPPREVKTIGDGLTTQRLGHLTFPIVLRHCEKQVFTVTDTQIIDGMRLLWERCKIVVEASSAATVAAAIFAPRFKELDARIAKIGLILSGGNVDLDSLPWVGQK